jgi:hypothetical protein
MYAVVSHVVFTSGMESKARTELHEEVVPGAQAAPGFNSGIWLISEDGKNGVGIEIFESEGTARTQMKRLRESAETYVSVSGRFDLFEVAAYER